jgi:hypothetical protein
MKDTRYCYTSIMKQDKTTVPDFLYEMIAVIVGVDSRTTRKIGKITSYSGKQLLFSCANYICNNFPKVSNHCFLK